MPNSPRRFDAMLQCDGWRDGSGGDGDRTACAGRPRAARLRNAPPPRARGSSSSPWSAVRIETVTASRTAPELLPGFRCPGRRQPVGVPRCAGGDVGAGHGARPLPWKWPRRHHCTPQPPQSASRCWTSRHRSGSMPRHPPTRSGPGCGFTAVVRWLPIRPRPGLSSRRLRRHAAAA